MYPLVKVYLAASKTIFSGYFLLLCIQHWLVQLGQNFFISGFTNPPTVNFQKVEKK